MQPRSPDEADYRLLTVPDANVRMRLAADKRGLPELQVFGNRVGLLSLANVLLWFMAHAWRREFLSLTELPFVQSEGPLSVSLRLTDEGETVQDGLLSRSDRGEQLEWAISENDLRRVALLVHRLASAPAHEYDRLVVAAGSVAGIHIRMTDAAEWL